MWSSQRKIIKEEEEEDPTNDGKIPSESIRQHLHIICFAPARLSATPHMLWGLLALMYLFLWLYLSILFYSKVLFLGHYVDCYLYVQGSCIFHEFHSQIVKWVLGTGPERAGYLFPKGKEKDLGGLLQEKIWEDTTAESCLGA